jgi:hypothetical protein
MARKSCEEAVPHMPFPALKDPYTRTAKDSGTGGTERFPFKFPLRAHRVKSGSLVLGVALIRVVSRDADFVG